jgi:hypothetical protein
MTTASGIIQQLDAIRIMDSVLGRTISSVNLDARFFVILGI